MRRPLRLVAVSISLAILLLAGLLLLVNLVPESRRVREPVVVDYGIGDSRFLLTSDAILQQPIVFGNHIDVLQDGDEILGAMLEAIHGARHSVTFETFMFWGEWFAGRVADAMADAAGRGVSVHAIIDYVGAFRADSDIIDRMERAGVEVVIWRPPSWGHLLRFNHRTHRKLLIVDGREGFIGGANIADKWLPGKGPIPYRDYHFRVRGPVVASMQAAFSEGWLDGTGNLLEGERYFPEPVNAGELPAQMVSSSPSGGRHRIRKMFLYAIAAAEKNITAGTGFFYPDAGFMDALIDAANRGVDVRILIPGTKINYEFLRHASVNRIYPLLEAGIVFYEYEPAVYHSKLMSIDDQWVSIGSANLDNRSFWINDEANLNVYDAGFARQIRELLEQDMENARRCDIDCWYRRPGHHRVFGWIGMLIGSQL